MTRDLTTGSPMRLIAGFTLPTLLGLLFQQLYNLVDTMIVGKLLGSAALAAVGSTGSISFLVIGFCMGICNGFAIPVAQRIGAGEPSKMRRYVANAAYLGAGIAVVLTAATGLLCRTILTAMQTPEEIFADAYSYIFVIFMGIPASILYNLLAAIMRSLGDSKTPVYFLALASILNIGLDFAFILLFRAGVAGRPSPPCSPRLCPAWPVWLSWSGASPSCACRGRRSGLTSTPPRFCAGWASPWASNTPSPPSAPSSSSPPSTAWELPPSPRWPPEPSCSS